MSVAAPRGQKKDLGQILVDQGLLTAAQLTTAFAEQRRNQKEIGQVFIDLGFVTEEDVTRARAAQSDIQYVRIQDLQIDRNVLGLLDPAVAARNLILPIGKTPEGTLKIVVAAWSSAVMDAAVQLATASRLRISPSLATEAHVRAAIEQYYGQPGAPRPAQPVRPKAAVAAPSESVPGQIPAGARNAVPAVVPPGGAANANPQRSATPAVPNLDRRHSELFGASATMANPLRQTGTTQSATVEDVESANVDQPIVIQFINRILADAIDRRASDIHFEPRREGLDIRFRIDGALQHIDNIRSEFQEACASRLKIMAEMNIAERRLPQDGRLAVILDGRNIDMRVSSLPTQFGESIVLRILDKNGVRPSIDDLGFSDRNLKALKSIIKKPHGIILATGPTGSGKTTTLYSALQEIHKPDVNIITVEDPIEYHLEGIRQSNVNEKAGLTFARQLRAILRQDPDVIYVGEIRDGEAAEIAFRAALTGHLVLSTLHCNDAAGAVTRLLNMGVDHFLVASSVVGVMAQRLVRRICPTCAMPYTPTDEELQAFGVDKNSEEYKHALFMKGIGCEDCGQTGYRSRFSIQEILVMDDVLRNMVLSRQASNKIRKVAMQRGMTSMRQDAASKVMQGITTFEEAQKRVFIEDEPEEPDGAF